MRISGQMIIGFIIIFIGLNILFSNLTINFPIGAILISVLFVMLGLYFWRKGNKMVGGILTSLGIITFFHNVLHIKIVGILISLAMVYIGFRLLGKDQRANKKENTQDDSNEKVHWSFKDDLDKDIDREIDKLSAKFKHKFSDKDSYNHDFEDSSTDESNSRSTKFHTQEVSSILGDFLLHNHRFELEDLVVNNGIGDVKIDLSKAIISPGETILDVRGWVGDVHIYVPYDLDVSISAKLGIGDLNVLGHEQSGLTRTFSTQSTEFELAPKRVRIILSLGIGDIDVRYV